MVALGPEAIFDRDVSSVSIACFAQPVVECGYLRPESDRPIWS